MLMQLHCFHSGAVKQSGQFVGQTKGGSCCVRNPSQHLAVIRFTGSFVAIAPRVRLFAEMRVSTRQFRIDLQPPPGCLPSQDVFKVPASQ